MSARERINRGAWSWAIFEWGRNPYVILCSIYVFAPYVATVVIGDPVRGQEVISGWHKIGGVVVALTAPFVGAIGDTMGRRKPLLAALVAMMFAAIMLEWWALPAGAGGLPLWALGAAVIVAGVGYALTEVLHNSMLTSVAPPRVLPYVSGLGLALGNAASVLLLVFVLVGIALPGHVAGLPERPLFGLDPARFEPSRSVAPLSAMWLLVFSLPLFLFAPDGRAGGVGLVAALRSGVGNVVRTIRKLNNYRNIALFLVARMFYADGKISILLFGGVYAAGVLGWELIELLAYGVLLSVFAVFGGLASGFLDNKLGSRNAVAFEVGVTLACLVSMVSMSRDAIFFFIPVEPGARVWAGPVFETAPEVAYLGVSVLIAMSITAAFASSRTLLARLAPAGMEGELFGLYALSSAATAWLGPLLVQYFTAAYHSQKAGFASIALLLLAGLALLAFVRGPARAD